jgi:RNA recognition motif-containing protein
LEGIAITMAEDTVSNKPKRSHDEDDEEDRNPAKGEEEDDAPKRKRKRKRKNKEIEPDGSKPDQDSSNEAKLASLDHTVYVEGIPFDCSENDLKEFFVTQGCGDVIQMRLPR